MYEIQFETARKMMVDCQLRPTKVTDERVLDAFGTIPREDFVGKHQRAMAYADEDLQLTGGRYLMEPMVLARLVQALNIQAKDNILVVGGGTGYGTAIVARLGGSVITVETRAQLVEKAQENLVSIGVDNAVVIKSRLVDGLAKEAPFDRILIEGSVETVPEKLLEQLTPRGTLVAVWRPAGAPIGVASIWSRSGDGFARKPLFDAQVPLLEDFKAKAEFVF